MEKKTTRADRFLTETAKAAAEYLKEIYGPRSLKRILSAGVIILSHLPSDQREQAMAAIDTPQIDEADTPQENIQKLKNILKTTESIRILGPEESKLADKIRQALGPELPRQKEKAKRG